MRESREFAPLTHPSPSSAAPAALYPSVSPVTPSAVVAPCLPVWLSYANQNQIHGWAESGSTLQVGTLLALTVQDLSPVLTKGPLHPSLEAALAQAVVVQLVSIEQSPKGDGGGPEQPIRWVAQRLSGQATFAVRYATPLHPQYVLTLTQTKYPVLWPLYNQVAVDTGRLKGITLFQADTETLMREGVASLMKALPPTASVLLLDSLQLQPSLPTVVVITWLVLGETARLSIDRLSVPVFLRLVASMVPPVFADQAMMQMASCITVDRPLLGLSSLGKPASPFHPLLKRELSALHQDDILAQTPDQVLRLDDWRAGLCRRLGLALHRWPERYVPWLLEALTLELAAGTPQSGHVMIVITLDGAQVSSAWIEACQRWAHASQLSVVLATVGINQEPWQEWAHSCIRKEQSGLLTLEGTVSALASLRIDPLTDTGTPDLSLAPLSAETGSAGLSSPSEAGESAKPSVSPSEEEAARMDFSGFILRQLGAYKVAPPVAPPLGSQATGAIAPLFPALESPAPASHPPDGQAPVRFNSFQVAFDPTDLPPDLDPDLPPVPPLVSVTDDTNPALSLSSYQVDLEADTPNSVVPDVSHLGPEAFNALPVDRSPSPFPETPTPPSGNDPSSNYPPATSGPMHTGSSELDQFAWTSLPLSAPEQELPPPPSETVMQGEDWPPHPCLPLDMVDVVRMAMNQPPQEAGVGLYDNASLLPASTSPAVFDPEPITVPDPQLLSPSPSASHQTDAEPASLLTHPQQSPIQTQDWDPDHPTVKLLPVNTPSIAHVPGDTSPEANPTADSVDWNLPPTHELLPADAMTRLPHTPDWLDFEMDWDSLDPTASGIDVPMVTPPPPFEASVKSDAMPPIPDKATVLGAFESTQLPPAHPSPVVASSTTAEAIPPDTMFSEFETVLDSDFLMPEDRGTWPPSSPPHSPSIPQGLQPVEASEVTPPPTLVMEPWQDFTAAENTPPSPASALPPPTEAQPPSTYSLDQAISANVQPPAVLDVDWSEAQPPVATVSSVSLTETREAPVVHSPQPPYSHELQSGLSPAPAPSLTPATATVSLPVSVESTVQPPVQPSAQVTAPTPLPSSSSSAPPAAAESSSPPAAKQYEGKRVGHPTYGHGTVKKVLELDGRMILTIQFDGVGKRLLDPSLSPLEVLDNSLGPL
jgi:hypothetical protein